MTITGVRVRSEGDPAVVGHALRRIPARADRERPDAARWWPTVATYGDLLAPRTARRLSGDIEPGEAGFVIDNACQSTRDPSAPVVELLTTMAAGSGGAAVLEQSIDYVAEGRAHTLTVPWSYVVCGPSISDPECEPYRSAYAER